MNKKTAAAGIVLLLAILLWVGIHLTRVYETTVNGHNGPITVSVSTSGKKITNVEILDDRETIGVGKCAVAMMPERILRAQSLNVDTVSGATVTSGAILAGVEQALLENGIDTAYLKKPLPSVTAPDETLCADVVVVGGGGAGLCAAISAEQHGAKVLVLEKLDFPGGSTNVSEGALNAVDPKRQKPMGIEDSVDNFISQTYHGGHETGNMALITYMCENALSSVEWLESLGAEFKDTVGMATGALFQRSHYPVTPSGNSYIRVFEEYAASHENLELRTGVEVTGLITEDGRIAGVSGKAGDGHVVTVTAPSVIVATGGFGANKQMLAEYNTGVWSHVNLTELGCTNLSRAACGDGIRMAAAIGADVTGMSDIQIHPCGTPGTGLMENIRTSGRNRIFVNSRGRRFVNESAARDVLSQAIFDQEGGTYWIVVNSVRYPARDFRDSNGATIENMAARGCITEADTPRELAEKCGMDPDALQESLDSYNAVVRGEKTDEFGFLADSPDDRELTEGPWYACRKVPTVHHTMGGLVIDTNARVLDTSGTPIPGLYAAGEVTGGIHGQNRLGGNAIADLMTFGRKAGEMAAENALR